MGQISSQTFGVTQEECAGIKGGYREIKENQKSADSTRRGPVGCSKEHGAGRVVSNAGFRGMQGRPRAGCEGCGPMFNGGSSGAVAQGREESRSREPWRRGCQVESWRAGTRFCKTTDVPSSFGCGGLRSWFLITAHYFPASPSSARLPRDSPPEQKLGFWIRAMVAEAQHSRRWGRALNIRLST